jgi:hypothetical protein
MRASTSHSPMGLTVSYRDSNFTISNGLWGKRTWSFHYTFTIMHCMRRWGKKNRATHHAVISQLKSLETRIVLKCHRQHHTLITRTARCYGYTGVNWDIQTTEQLISYCTQISRIVICCLPRSTAYVIGIFKKKSPSQHNSYIEPFKS